jgi:hypothetical protein
MCLSRCRRACCAPASVCHRLPSRARAEYFVDLSMSVSASSKRERERGGTWACRLRRLGVHATPPLGSSPFRPSSASAGRKWLCPAQPRPNGIKVACLLHNDHHLLLVSHDEHLDHPASQPRLASDDLGRRRPRGWAVGPPRRLARGRGRAGPAPAPAQDPVGSGPRDGPPAGGQGHEGP